MRTGENKNLLRIAEALQGIPCHLRVIGRLSREQASRLQACGVDFTAAEHLERQQMVQEYRDCDIMLLASLAEGFGLPILEAQATGRPVVTSSVPPMPEVAGEGACYVDPLCVDSIRAGLLRVRDDAAARQRWIAEGFRNVERFRPAVVARQYAALYEELMQC